MQSYSVGGRAPQRPFTIYHGPIDSGREARMDDADHRGHQQTDHVQQLAAGVAQSVGSLLSGARRGALMALDCLADDHPARIGVELSNRACAQATELVSQLMAYAQIRPLVALPVDLSRVIADALASQRRSIPRHVTFRLHLAANLPLVRADSSAIAELTHALLTNSLEAIGAAAGTVVIRTCVQEIGSPAGGEYRLAASRWPPGACVCLEVSDTGCGIDEYLIPNIFGPFFSTKSPGRGLGLASAAGIARAHRAAISVESVPGCCSIFRVYFPLWAPDGYAREARAA